jgi:hypothetical protein
MQLVAMVMVRDICDEDYVGLTLRNWLMTDETRWCQTVAPGMERVGRNPVDRSAGLVVPGVVAGMDVALYQVGIPELHRVVATTSREQRREWAHRTLPWAARRGFKFDDCVAGATVQTEC